LEQSVASNKSRLAAVIRQPPKVVERWKQLRIGEFESTADFRLRVDRRKELDQLETQAAVLSFNRRKRDAQAALDRSKRDQVNQNLGLKVELSSARRGLNKVLASPPLVRITTVLRPKQVVLPFFKRATMSFGPIVFGGMLPGHVQESKISGSSNDSRNRAFRLTEPSRLSYRVTIPTLAQAQEFKQGLQKGTLTCAIDWEVHFLKIERPFQVVESFYKVENEWVTLDNFGRLIAGLAVAGIAASSGTELSRDQQIVLASELGIRPEKVTKRYTRTRRIDGSKYHYQLRPRQVRFQRANGSVVDYPRVTDLRSQ
jgi:hypothetical protein